MMWQTMSIPIGRRRTVSESVVSPSGGISPGSSPGNFLEFNEPMTRKQRSQSARKSSTKVRLNSTSSSNESLDSPDGDLRYSPPGPTSIRLRAYSSPSPTDPRHHRASFPTKIQEEISFREEEDQATRAVTHKDFSPQILHGKREEFTSFKDIVIEANEWLEENRGVNLLSCETVIWSGLDKSPIYTDSAVDFKNMAAGRKTRINRGLRLWYISHGDKFWHQTGARQRIAYRDYNLPGHGETTKSALKQINQDIKYSAIRGRIIKLETLHLPSHYDITPETCVWRENAEGSRRFQTMLRLFFVEYEGAPVIQDEIVLRDFCPHSDNRSPHIKGYESFRDIYSRAARWAYHKQHIKVINTQTLYMKSKKDIDKDSLRTIKLWEHTSFTEHGDKKTDYFVVVRMVYTKPSHQSGPIRPSSLVSPYRFTYRTFVPAPLVNLKTVAEQTISEKSFEDLRSTEERLASWLQSSGASVCGVETVRVRCRSGGQEVAGPEATSVYHLRDQRTQQEPWLNCIRVYLNGDYKDTAHSGTWYPWQRSLSGPENGHAPSDNDTPL